jgi:hypothetical protein
MVLIVMENKNIVVIARLVPTSVKLNDIGKKELL